MSAKTSIEWTESTWNPISGCSKVSQGCKNCYAERDWARLQHLPAYAGRAFTDVAMHADRLEQPLRWRRPKRIFVNSMSDLFHADVPDDFIDKVFAVMALAKQHTFQILTKRPDRMRAYLFHGARAELVGIEAEALSGLDRHTEAMSQRWPFPLPNVWLGVSVEDQASADDRIPLLLQTPAAVRWISAEPLLGPVSLPFERIGHWNALAIKSNQPWATTRLHWVVVGGESGPKARPMHPEWVRSLRDQCSVAGVPLLFKQWGEWAPYDRSRTDSKGLEAPSALDDPLQRVGKRLAGRMLDGVLHDEYPH